MTALLDYLLDYLAAVAAKHTTDGGTVTLTITRPRSELVAAFGAAPCDVLGMRELRRGPVTIAITPPDIVVEAGEGC